jgi:hypothetical protein
MLATINTPKVQAPFGVYLLQTDDKNYLALNFLITVVGFSIYKSYYISEQKTKYIDVYKIFANEYITRILLERYK